MNRKASPPSQVLSDFLCNPAHPISQAPAVQATQEAKTAADFSEDELAMVNRFRRLTASRQKLIGDLLVEFVLEQEVWPKSEIDNPAPSLNPRSSPPAF